MIALYNGETHNCVLRVYKGQSEARESFAHAVPKLFVVGSDKQIIDCTVEDNDIKFTLPVGMTPETYDVQLIWCKNTGTDLTPRNFGSAVFNFAEVQDAFSVTENEDEATEFAADKKLVICTHVATYGYNGLSAYETAIMYGITTALSEKEYVQIRASYVDTNQIKDSAITTAKIADEAVTTAKLADYVEGDEEKKGITTDKITDNAVTEEKIADEAVTNKKIADYALTEEKFAPGTIDALQKMDLSIKDDGHLWVGLHENE